MPSTAMTLNDGFGNRPVQTMSSREIADLCETRHNQVIETIERLFAKGVLRESRKTTRSFRPDGGGRPTEVYDLTKRDTLVVASGYNDELRARIIDKWQEYEARERLDPIVALNDPATMRGLLLTYSEKVLELEQTNAELTPKADALDRISASDGSMTFTQAAKLLGVKQVTMTNWMHANRWIYRQNGSWVAYQAHILNGRLEYKEAKFTNHNTGMEEHKPYCHLTPKGLAKLAVALGADGAKAA